MAISLLESIMPAFVSLFIGPWSDKFGRRPILLTVFTGKIMMYYGTNNRSMIRIVINFE